MMAFDEVDRQEAVPEHGMKCRAVHGQQCQVCMYEQENADDVNEAA